LTTVVSARGLTKIYNQQSAVAAIDFSVKRGETFGLLGPNGAGKSTTMRMIACRAPLTSGELLVEGLDVRTQGREIRSLIGVVPQENNLDPDLNVRRNLIVYASYFRIPKPQAAQRADLQTQLTTEFENIANRILKANASELSENSQKAVAAILEPLRERLHDFQSKIETTYESEAREIQARYGSVESQLGYLASNKRIQPLTTQGSVTDLNPHRIVYDARTGEGGSGAPLFGPSGRVIGITFAIFTENTASNFAVPIRYAITLLERSGWTGPQNPDAEPKEAAAANQANTR